MPSRIRNEAHKQSQREWYIKNRERLLEKAKITEYKNRRKQLRLLPSNKARQNAAEARRESLKRLSTPPWVTKQHLNKIKELFWLAKDLEIVSGQKYHVDHIVPLKSNLVCGLHVHWNLQVLPADINLSKGNRYDY